MFFRSSYLLAASNEPRRMRHLETILRADPTKSQSDPITSAAPNAGHPVPSVMRCCTFRSASPRHARRAPHILSASPITKNPRLLCFHKYSDYKSSRSRYVGLDARGVSIGRRQAARLSPAGARIRFVRRDGGRQMIWGGFSCRCAVGKSWLLIWTRAFTSRPLQLLYNRLNKPQGLRK